jgi:hypothetical protein
VLRLGSAWFCGQGFSHATDWTGLEWSGIHPARSAREVNPWIGVECALVSMHRSIVNRG